MAEVAVTAKRHVPQSVTATVLLLLFGFSIAIYGAAVATCADAEGAVTIIAGPTVSDINQTSVTISWSTSAPGTSMVLYGKTPTMDQVFRKNVPFEETEIPEMRHNMMLWELEPGTVYYFQVKTSGSEGTVLSERNQFTTLSP